MLREKSQLLTNIHRTLDIIWVIVAFISAYYIKRNWMPESLSGLSTAPNYYVILLIAICVCFLVFNSFSLYESNRTKPMLVLVKKNIEVVSFSLFFLVSFLFLLHFPPLNRLFFLIFGALLFCTLTISKIIIYKSLSYHRARDYNTRNVLIVGSGNMAVETIRAIVANPGSGYRLIGCLETNPENVEIGKSVLGDVMIIGGVAQFKSHFKNNVIDELIFATQPLDDIVNVLDIIGFAEELGVNVRIMPDFQINRILFKPETAKIQVKQFFGLPTLSISSVSENESGVIIKSIIDYFCASFGLIVLSPVLIVICFVIKVSSPGPVLFFQERCGLYGRKFKMIKFRTMVVDADKRKAELSRKNEMDGPVFKIRHDPRITGVGKILRKTSLDEIPQLVNVIMGHMSIVGPRPPLPEEVEHYKSWQRRRLSMKPGLTCLWQVDGRNDINFEKWMKLDLLYIDSWTLWLDFKIMLLTLREIFRFNGR